MIAIPTPVFEPTVEVLWDVARPNELQVWSHQYAEGPGGSRFMSQIGFIIKFREGALDDWDGRHRRQEILMEAWFRAGPLALRDDAYDMGALKVERLYEDDPEWVRFKPIVSQETAV